MAEKSDRDELDPSRLVDLLEIYLLGEAPTLTGNEIAERLGITFETASQRWRSLGFSAVGGDVPAFTQADLDALELTERLSELGLVEQEDESALVRALGRSFARLAEWQMGLLARTIDLETMSLEEVSEIMTEVTPAVEALQSYIWRRHTLSAASRLLLANQQDDEIAERDGAEPPDGSPAGSGEVLGVGFADIVNFTRQSRQLTRGELARLVDRFEERSLAIISERGGRIIKTIGDEILFVADDPAQVALIGLELVEERHRDEDFPELRVGLAWGTALARLGDVLGPVVNVASRLTSTSRPGRVLVDRTLAEQLQDDPQFKLRRLRRTSVRGYRRLEPWSVRRPADQDPEVTEEGSLPGPVSALINQQAKDFRRAVDQIEARIERSTAREGAEQGPDR